MAKFFDALFIVNKIILDNPNLILAGALGRILLGIKPMDDVGDIDFVVYDEKDIPKDFIKSDMSNLHVKGDYTHYRKTVEGVKVCLFLIPEGNYVDVCGLKVQNKEELLYWKNKFDGTRLCQEK